MRDLRSDLLMPTVRNTYRGLRDPRRHVATLTAIAVCGAGLFTGIGTTARADGPGSARAKVFCGGAKGLVYRFRPSACDFHERGFQLSDQAGYTLTRRLHWSHWGPRSATASGEIAYPMAGWYRVLIRLSDPHAGCGRTVFTIARLHVPGKARGGLKIPLDRCPVTTE